MQLVLLTKACTSLVAYTVGDVVAQVAETRRFEDKDKDDEDSDVELDPRRIIRNACLGFFLHGPYLHFWIQFLEGPFSNALQQVDPALTTD